MVEEISKEFIEQLKANDHRWNDVDYALKIEEELRSSEALKSVLHVLNERAIDALDKLVMADATDHKLILSLQARVQCARLMGETLESIRRRGAIAAQTLQEDDRQGILLNEEGQEDDRG